MITKIIIMSVGIAIGLLPALYIFFYARKKAKKRTMIQQEILNKYSGEQVFPVRYCSQKRFKKIWKFFPWEATGILLIKDNIISCDLCSTNGEKFNLDFEVKDISLSWLGRKNWFKNGVASWFIIGKKQKHYFTSDTGTLVFGSMETTKEILTKIKDNS